MRRGAYVAAIAAVALGIRAYVAASAETESGWVRVARDANYDVAIDSGRVHAAHVADVRRRYDVYDVWYRTDHATARLHEGRAFNREIVHSIVQCDSLWFKVMSVDMRMGGTLVARQRSSDRELSEQSWRRVERGTTEEVAAAAACYYGSRLSRMEGRRDPRP